MIVSLVPEQRSGGFNMIKRCYQANENERVWKLERRNRVLQRERGRETEKVGVKDSGSKNSRCFYSIWSCRCRSSLGIPVVVSLLFRGSLSLCTLSDAHPDPAERREDGVLGAKTEQKRGRSWARWIGGKVIETLTIQGEKTELRRQTIKEKDTNIDILESIKPSDNVPWNAIHVVWCLSFFL